MSSSAESVYYYNQSLAKQGVAMLVIGVILFAVILVLPLPPHAGAVVSAPMLMIVLGIANIFLYSNKEALVFYEKHLELKVAPLAALHIIKYDDIQDIVMDGKKILIYKNSTAKPIKLHERIFNKDDIALVKSHLQHCSGTKLNPAV